MGAPVLFGGPGRVWQFTFHSVATNGTGRGTFKVLLDHSSGHWKFASISRLGS